MVATTVRNRNSIGEECYNPQRRITRLRKLMLNTLFIVYCDQLDIAQFPLRRLHRLAD